MSSYHHTYVTNYVDRLSDRDTLVLNCETCGDQLGELGMWPTPVEIMERDLEHQRTVSHDRDQRDGRGKCPVHGIPDCSPLLNGCSRLTGGSQ